MHPKIEKLLTLILNQDKASKEEAHPALKDLFDYFKNTPQPKPTWIVK